MYELYETIELYQDQAAITAWQQNYFAAQTDPLHFVNVFHEQVRKLVRN